MYIQFSILYNVVVTPVYLTEAGAYPQLPTQPNFFDHFQTYTAI